MIMLIIKITDKCFPAKLFVLILNGFINFKMRVVVVNSHLDLFVLFFLIFENKGNIPISVKIISKQII